MNPALPQNAPWVPSDQLVTPYQTIANPISVAGPGGFAARRGAALRNGSHPRQPNLSPLAWAGIAAGTAAAAGGGYWWWRRRQAAQLEAETGVSVDGDCTKMTVTDAQVGPAYLASFADAAMTALGDAPVSTLVFAAGYIETVAPQCGVSVDEAGIQGLDTWQKAAMLGGIALMIAGHLHDSGQIEDDLFKLEAEEIQAFWLEHGVDDPGLIEEVFELPPDTQAAAGGMMGPGGLGTYEQMVGGRVPNSAALTWGILGTVAGGVLGALMGLLGGVQVARTRVVHRAKVEEGGVLWEQVVVRDPGLGAGKVGIGDYLGIVMGFPIDEQLDTAGFPENRATDAIWIMPFGTLEDAVEWTAILPRLLSEGAPENAGDTGRVANLGILGWGLLGVGAATAGSGGYLWWRNRKLTEACLGATQWLTADKNSLTPETEAALGAAMDAAAEAGMEDPFELADSAIVAVSGNEGCRLPKLIWGDLLRVRALAIAMAAKLIPGGPRAPEEPIGPDESGLEATAACDKIVVHDLDVAQASFETFLTEMGLTPDMSWTPNTIMLGASYLEAVAPQCGVGVAKTGAPDILGVDTPQKAAMVGAFALMAAGTLQEWGVFTDEAFTQESLRLNEWLMAHGVDDLAMLEEVFEMPGTLTPGESDGGSGFHSESEDDWGEPVANTLVDSGSVGGEDGGLWRVYLDQTGEFANQHYYVIWKKGAYYRGGPYPVPDQAREGAIQALTAQQAGLASNPSARDAVMGVLAGKPYAQGMGALAGRTRVRNPKTRLVPSRVQNARRVPAHFPMQMRFNNPLPDVCPGGSRPQWINGHWWCKDPKTGGWICAETSGSCTDTKKTYPGTITSRPRPKRGGKLVRRARARNCPTC